MSDESKVELKPCPFCGGDVETGYYAEEFAVECPSCRFSISSYDDGPSDPSSKGVNHWNTRAAPKVKPLEWDKTGKPASEQQAQNYIGVWVVYENAIDGWTMDSSEFVSSHDSIDEAKAAAQADYERRILSELV